MLVDDEMRLTGLITMRDIDLLSQFPLACRDDRGRLRVGAAVGVHQPERVEALIAAEVDVLSGRYSPRSQQKCGRNGGIDQSSSTTLT